MRKFLPLALAGLLLVAGCNHHRAGDTVVMIIESSPTNLDPRVGTDAQSERIGKLIFDSLVHRTEHFALEPMLARSWEISPDGLTYTFHLRGDVRFHNGAPLTSRDVKWTYDSVLSGGLITPKASSYQSVASVEAPDATTVVFHLREPNASLLWNVSDGAMGIIPYGSDRGFNHTLIGSGPFKFVSAAQDDYVLLERNEDYWGSKPKIARVRFAVVPDTTTRVLELRKGSADIESNAITADMVSAIRSDRGETGGLMVEEAPGSIYQYLALNLRDPALKDLRVRQALAHAIDIAPILRYLWRDQARPANSVLPPQHWAYDAQVPTYSYDPAEASALLTAAGYIADAQGVRLHLTMKTSTEESGRLLAAVLQQQLRAAGIALEIRSYEFATFYSDIVKGSYQMYSLRWIGGNEDPDIFEHVFDSASFPPVRANRSYYANPTVDRLLADAGGTTDQARRRADYFKVQETVAHDLPYINLWYLDNVVVHTPRIHGLRVPASGSYDFLRDIEVSP